MTTTLLLQQFCILLKSHMHTQNLTQTELANRSGVHPVTISRLLNGNLNNLTFDTAEKLLRAIRIKPEKLFQH